MRNFFIIVSFFVTTVGCNNGKKSAPTLHGSGDSTNITTGIADTVSDIEINPNIQIMNNSFKVDGAEYKHKSLVIFGKRMFLVEGDILLDTSGYNQYQISYILKKPVDEILQKTVAGLVVMGKETENGKVPLLVDPNQVLKYVIIKHSFPSKNDYQEYKIVRQNFENACRQWMGLCNVHFQHIDNLDNSAIIAPSGEVNFIVCKYNVNGAFIAQSFFPNTDADQRYVLIDPSYFTTSFNKVGVFRHEIGHILGLRHEHSRTGAPLGCPTETSDGNIELTPYDGQSVMHYFCGGLGDTVLQFSRLDSIGVINLYGRPH